ncbi:MAG: hypA [Gemmataceae bacterium]|nr:hypA [Gemmataceae bacterium]
MHELSIALSIVDLAAEEIGRRGGSRIGAIHLKLGPLSGVVPGALRSAFELAREQEPAVAAAELIIEEIAVAAYCPACAAEQLITFPELCCPTCGIPTPDVIRGRELEVVALEIES